MAGNSHDWKREDEAEDEDDQELDETVRTTIARLCYNASADKP